MSGHPDLRLAVYTDSSILGGAERGLRGLIGALGPHVEVVVLGPDPMVTGALAKVRPGTRSIVVPSIRGKWDVRGMARFARVLRAVGPDVLQVTLTTPWSCRRELAIGVLTPGVRVVAVENLPLPITDPHARRVKRLVSGRLAAHVAVGVGAAREVEAGAGLRPGAVRTIEVAVSEFRVVPDGRKRERPLIGTTARLDHQKALDVLLHAMVLLPEVELELVGDGPELESLQRLAHALGIADRVVFAGWSEDARAWLARWDAFVLPSRNEGLPLAILDAMLAELPIVATDVGSVAEAIADGETGLIVEVDDAGALAAAIGRLLEDRPLAARLGRRARTVALDRFIVDGMARRYEDLYTELLGEGKGRGGLLRRRA